MTMKNNLPNDRFQQLYNQLVALRNSIQEQTLSQLSPYSRYFPDGLYTPGAINLIQYLLLRQTDLRELQLELNEFGLSSLGRGEENILDNLNKVIRLLEKFSETHIYQKSKNQEFDILPEINPSNESLSINANKIMGVSTPNRKVRIMVTLPSEAASDYQLVYSLVNSGMNCARINCAHDSKHEWLEMIRHVRLAENATGKQCHIMMDIAGQKIRTGPFEPGPAVCHLKVKKNEYGKVVAPASLLLLPATKYETLQSKYSSEQFCLGIDDAQHASLTIGDSLEFTDVRRKKRALHITQTRDNGILVAQCTQAAYIVPDTIFRWSRRSGSHKRYNSKLINIKVFPFTPGKIKLFTGDKLLLTGSNTLGKAAVQDETGNVIQPATISTSHDEILPLLKPGNPVWIDDGKVGTIVEEVRNDGILLNVTLANPKGVTIKPDKGLNFPDTDISLNPLTDKDLEDLDFIAEYADMVAYSFVQSKEDMAYLIYELKQRNATQIPIIAKIETQKAVKNLPEIILSSIGRIPLGIMIARGDLAVELGSIRMAEIQEEILWVCEAAHVPVIWATQVLESLAKNGIQSRPEITDAAMSVRAECVMLNKGAYIQQALEVLDNILTRMQEHQYKKMPRMRALKQWVTRESSPVC